MHGPHGGRRVAGQAVDETAETDDVRVVARNEREGLAGVVERGGLVERAQALGVRTLDPEVDLVQTGGTSRPSAPDRASRTVQSDRNQALWPMRRSVAEQEVRQFAGHTRIGVETRVHPAQVPAAKTAGEDADLLERARRRLRAQRGDDAVADPAPHLPPEHAELARADAPAPQFDRGQVRVVAAAPAVALHRQQVVGRKRQAVEVGNKRTRRGVDDLLALDEADAPLPS